MTFQYKYSRPALSVDCVVFGLEKTSALKVLLIQRAKDPFKDCWALPGGFVNPESDSSLEFAAKRKLLEETGVEELYLEQLQTFGNKERDPREWTASVAYYALVNLSQYKITADKDAAAAEWFEITEIPRTLAFDHHNIVELAVKRLRSRIRRSPIGFDLLPRKFTLSQLQKLYEVVLGAELDKRNFLRELNKMNLLLDLEEYQQDVSHRPAKLYQFDQETYEKLSKDENFVFAIKLAGKPMT
jgi:8-oxo-dGTP diphosphatase